MDSMGEQSGPPPAGNGGPEDALPLLHAQRRAPAAVVVRWPSDHFIREEGRGMAAVQQAAAVVAERPAYPVMLGVEPTGPAVGYGWSAPGAGRGARQGKAV